MSTDIQEAKRVLDIESQSILDLKDRIDDRFIKAIEIIMAGQAKVVVAGMGKSGHIGRKLAATLSSTGTPSLFLHPAESSHGDLGVVTSEDVLIVISYGGGSQELQDLIAYASRKGVPMIAMTGNMDSELARSANVVLDISVKEEACPLKLAPTSSSTATLALCDALAMALLKRRGFKEEDFAEFHPGGKLGRRLLTRVHDLMHDNGGLPIVELGSSMVSVVATMTGGDVRGVAAVVDKQGFLKGVVTDGDLRRHLEKNKNPLEAKVEELMSTTPKTIDADELAAKALFIMEQFSIQSLFVVDSASKKPVGLIHLQDLIRAQIR
ncbi:MAG: KpsF/GutQ family sugar-phosphate isomerase [Bdellovibrionales bacterium]|nr:KpsF/GutQ family sugar-phosphate isomerase [Bdellovibrionales bacterium]